jgi:Protein of unknown function (DUF3592)
VPLNRPTRSENAAQDYVKKGFGTLFFSVFAILGLAFTGIMLWSIAQTLRPYFWKTTPCTILQSERATDGLERTSNSGEPIVIRYRYEAGGRAYESTRLDKGIKRSIDSNEVERLLFKYAADTNSICYVNASNPEEAVLRRGSLWPALFIFLPLVFVAVGVGGIIAVWRGEKWKQRTMTRRQANALGSVGKVFFFGVFTLVGGILGYFFIGRPLQTYFAAKDWPETPCEIVRSSVVPHAGSKGSSTYSIDITYRYEVRGRELQSSTYSITSLSGSSSAGRSSKEKVVARYPAGMKTVCYVNPEDPTDTLLNRDLSPWLLLGLIPAIFLSVGLVGLGSMIRPALRRMRERSTMPILPGTSAIMPNAPIGQAMAGPVVLNPQHSPMAKFWAAVFFALFWNGITGVFVWIAVMSFIDGKPEWFLTVFITPFVLIGLVVLLFVGSTFLNLFNPRMQLTLNSPAVPLGGTLDATWLISGSSSRIEHLKLTVEGREETSHGSGKTRRTERKVFVTLPLAETNDPQQIARGRASVEIPEGHKPSQDEDYPKVIWTVKAVGQIPRYPDLEEEFEITVLAREVH